MLRQRLFERRQRARRHGEGQRGVIRLAIPTVVPALGAPVGLGLFLTHQPGAGAVVTGGEVAAGAELQNGGRLW